jgi:hypothetical protein
MVVTVAKLSLLRRIADTEFTFIGSGPDMLPDFILNAKA